MDISALKIRFVEAWFHLVLELSKGALGGNATRRVRGGQHSLCPEPGRERAAQSPSAHLLGRQAAFWCSLRLFEV